MLDGTRSGSGSGGGERGGAPAAAIAMRAPDAHASSVILHAALRASLEAIPHPAAVLSPTGVVCFANEAANRVLEGHRGSFIDAMGAGPQAAEHGVACTFHAVGTEGHQLAILRAAGTDADSRVLRWRCRFGLTQRQGEVLGLVARGLANGTIAELLGCRLRTVEAHLSAIFDRTGADSRTALVARFWTEG